MIGIVLALLAALTFALSGVLVRKKLDESNFISVASVFTVTGNIILWPFALLFTNLGTVSLEGVIFFAIAGILTGMIRLLNFKSIEVVGVSVTSSIFATSPVYISIFAVLMLSEILTPENWIGIICIVASAVLIERSLSESKTTSKRISKKGLVFALLGALTGAFALIVRKLGLNIYDKPLLGVAIEYSISFLLYLILSISFRTMRGSLFSGKGYRLFWKAGVCASLAWVLTFYALAHEKVSIVAPLTQTAPLFVLFFAYLYLRELERISFKLVIGILLVVIGAVLVTSS